MRISNCRLCNSSDIKVVIDLGFHPLADTFKTEQRLFNEPETTYPLQVVKCGDCHHLFTGYYISPETRYQAVDYSYDSSNSKVSIDHFEDFALTVIEYCNIKNASRIADIGSNVGTLLGHFKTRGFTDVTGIEPSANISKIANEQYGVNTINKFFDKSCTQDLILKGKINVLLSSNVVNHADDLGDFFDTAKLVLDPNGFFIFEVPYLKDLIENFAFDTIYHEHVHYHSICALNSFLESKGFIIEKVDFLTYMCGSIRVYTRLNHHNKNTYPHILSIIETEKSQGLFNNSTYARFQEDLLDLKVLTLNDLTDLKKQGNKIIGIGAATKGNTFLNFCGLDSAILDYIVDSSPLKIGKYTPGSHIPIYPDSAISDDVDYAVILPWNLQDFLERKFSERKNLKFYKVKIRNNAKN